MRGSGRESLAKESSMSVNGNSLRAAFAKSVSDHWVLFLVEGIVLLVLGFVAMVIPPLATLAVTILLGWLFLISGIVGLFTTFWARHAPGFGGRFCLPRSASAQASSCSHGRSAVRFPSR
jgi:hypothetical protein